MIKNSVFRRVVHLGMILSLFFITHAYALTTDQMTTALKTLYQEAVSFSKKVEDYPPDSKEKVTITRILNMLKQDAKKIRVLSDTESSAKTQAEYKKMAEQWKKIRSFIRDMEKDLKQAETAPLKTPEDILREIEAYRRRIESLESRLDEMPVPVDRMSERQRVEMAVKEEDWQTVKTRLDKALLHYPDDSELHYYLSLYMEAQKNYPAARDAILEALRLGSRNARYWSKAGDIYLQLGLYEQAFGAYAEMLLLDPRNVPARLNLAGLLMETGRVDSAQSLYEEVIQLNPSHPDAYEGLGRIAWQRGHNETAKTYYQKAITRNSRSPKLYLNLGQIYMDQKQYTYAIRHLEEVIRLDPDHTEARFLLGKAYWHTFDVARASVYWSQVYRRNNRAYNISFWLPAAYYVQAEILKNEDLFRESTRAFRNALDINPDSYHWISWGNYWLGKYYLTQNKPLLAETYYIKALETNPNLSEALIALGILKWEQSSPGEARKYWQQALKINPGNQEASAWLKMTQNNP